MQQWCVLLKYGELMLKGRNRSKFEHQLRRNLDRALAGLDGVQVRQRPGVMVVSGPAPLADLLRRSRDLVGISVVQPALRVDPTPAAAAETAVSLLLGRPAGTFAIRAHRRNKRFPLTSEQLNRHVGTVVCERLGRKVNLSAPDHEVRIEVDRQELYVYVDRYEGQGGLPVGVSGRALVLLSGGFDSPVAAYRAMRRGLGCDFVHFTGVPFTSPSSVLKAYALVRNLDRFQGQSRLYVVAFGKAQRALATAGAGRLQVLAQRRLMVRVANQLAERLGDEALVTGDSLGQVSSQTLANLSAVEAASALPLLRPLLGWDKAEIMQEGRRLGIDQISKLPDEDCCTLFASPKAETRAGVRELETLERRVDVDQLVEELLARIDEHHPGRGPAPDGLTTAA
ncbi:MAG: tRNA uracil 4-sulfurtransferase ThiI [Streptomycetales bacterium]